jgi:polysaccharide biosynthesis PFTS motif protein
MPELSQEDEKTKLITLFDIAPQQQFNDKNFYNDETALKFISDIIDLKAKIPKLKDYTISIKPKRELNRDFHSVKYIEFLERQQLDGKIIIEPWDANPYTLISKSSLIITMPFSSISYIGIEQGTKTIFYYPHSRKLLNLIYEDEIKLITGILELEDYLLGLVLD